MAQPISTALDNNKKTEISAAFKISVTTWRLYDTWEFSLLKVSEQELSCEIVMVVEDDIYTELEQQIDEKIYLQYHNKYL